MCELVKHTLPLLFLQMSVEGSFWCPLEQEEQNRQVCHVSTLAFRVKDADVRVCMKSIKSTPILPVQRA